MVLLREISASNRGIPAHGFHWHEPRSSGVHRELAATHSRDLGETAASGIHRAGGNGAGAWSGAAHRLGGNGRVVSHCGCAWRATDDTQRDKARFRHALGGELSGLGGVGCADSDSATRRRGSVARRTRGLDFATRSSDDRRAEAIRTAARRNGADVLRARLFGENTPSAEHHRQPGADGRVDCLADQTGTNPNGSQQMVAIAALAVAASCVSAAHLLIPTAPTLAISNVNRHVGLALLLSFAHFQNAQRALPAIAAYALAAPLMMVLYARWMRYSHQQL
jgi:hypothetical protein